jgi:glycosyltransferase involved in cell wall biosynthesis
VADAFYSDARYRNFTDIDVLVEPHSLERALRMLSSDEAVSAVPKRGPKADKRDVLFSDPSGMTFILDLHWNLFSYSQLRGSAEKATDAAWESAVLVEDSSLGPHWTLPIGTEIAFLAAHSILDHRFRLALFRDFVEVARRNVDWDDVITTCGRWGLRSTTYIPLWMANQVLEAEIPEGVLESLRPRSSVVSFLERALPRVDLARFDGHRVHPVNLGAVLLNDSPISRVGLAVRAPVAFPAWRRRAMESLHSHSAPKTLLVVSTNRRRGAEVLAERLRDGFTERGFQAEAVSLSSAGDETKADVENLSELSPDALGRFNLRAGLALRRRIRRFRPNVVVAFGPTLRYCVLAAFGTGSRLVYVAIGEPQYWVRSVWSAWPNRVLLRQTDRVVAVSAETKTQLLKFEPELDGRVFVSHTGVPRQMFRDSKAHDSGPLRVLVLGALSSEKDPLTALRTVAGVGQAHLRMVGSGPMDVSVRQEAENVGMKGRLELAGSVDDVSEHLEWADVLLLSSRTEGLPAAILEAGAAGVPSVAFDVGGVSEAITDGTTGLVVQAGDMGALTSALRSFDEDRTRVSEMGAAARRHMEKNFRLEPAIDEYIRLLTTEPRRSQP